MRNIKIYVVRSQVGFGQYIASAFRHFFYRSLKDQAAVHADERITDDFTAVDMTVCGQYMHSARAVCLQFRSQNTGLIGFFQNHSSGAVAEQNTSCSVFPIQNTRQSLCTDHQDALGRTSTNH